MSYIFNKFSTIDITYGIHVRLQVMKMILLNVSGFVLSMIFDIFKHVMGF